jgi:hypothetical protein
LRFCLARHWELPCNFGVAWASICVFAYPYWAWWCDYCILSFRAFCMVFYDFDWVVSFFHFLLWSHSQIQCSILTFSRLFQKQCSRIAGQKSKWTLEALYTWGRNNVLALTPWFYGTDPDNSVIGEKLAYG